MDLWRQYPRNNRYVAAKWPIFEVKHYFKAIFRYGKPYTLYSMSIPTIKYYCTYDTCASPDMIYV